METRKISSALLFCRGRLWNVQRFAEHTYTATLFCSLNLLFGGAHWRRGLLQTPSTLRRRDLKTHNSFLSTVRPMKTELFENVLQTGGIWKRRLWVFVWTKNILKRTFSNTIGSGEPRNFPGRDFLKQKYKTTGDWCVFKFLRCSVDDRA